MSYIKTNSYTSQSNLADFCRKGTLSPIKGIKEKNVSHYRRLVYNVVYDTLETAYPLTLKLIGEEQWENWVDDFWSNYKCQSAEMWMMPLEFHNYLEQKEDLPEKKTYPFLQELVWFEWLEIYFFLRNDEPNLFPIIENGNLNHHALVLNPELSIEKFTYPVFKKNANDITDLDKGTFFLCVHRQQDDEGNVIYNELSIPMVRLLELYQEKPLKMEDACQQVCADLSIQMNNTILQKIHDFVTHGLQTGIFIAFTNIDE